MKLNETKLPVKGMTMQQTLLLLKNIHRFVLFFGLLALAVIPLCCSTTAQTAFVSLPILFILFSILSISIENGLNRYEKRLLSAQCSKSKASRKCFLIKSLC